jgi:hypothetical protein
MQRSKVLALIALLGALVVGGAFGFTADRVLGRDPCKNPSDRGAMRRFLAEELSLTPTQRVAVDSILDKRHRDMSVVIAPVKPRLDSIRDAARAEVNKLLDEKQRRRFQKLIEESKRHDQKER